jgi:hypothetical protein
MLCGKNLTFDLENYQYLKLRIGGGKTGSFQ